MGLEVSFLGEGGGTEGTGVGLLTRMLNHVSLQRSFLVKSFSTFATFKWPFTCVYPDVPRQLARLLERLSAVRAGVCEAAPVDVPAVWPGAGHPDLVVCLHVLLEL